MGVFSMWKRCENLNKIKAANFTSKGVTSNSAKNCGNENFLLYIMVYMIIHVQCNLDYPDPFVHGLIAAIPDK